MTDLRVGVVGVPGGWSSELLADTFAARTDFRLLIDMERVALDTATGRVLFGDMDLGALDGIVVKKIGREYSPHFLDRLQLLRHLQDGGVPIFSKPTSILRLIDRLSCTVTLTRAGIPMPDTTITEDLDEAARAVARYGTAVLKPLYSTKARGMQLLDNSDPERIRTVLETFRTAINPVFYVQRKLEIPDRDFGVVFLGGEYVGTYSRERGNGSWNTTIHDGGRYAHHDAAPEVVDVARRAQALFDLDFTTVDVVETDRGPLVFEVSAFGGFRGLQDGLGIDAAGLIADHVLRRIAHA